MIPNSSMKNRNLSSFVVFSSSCQWVLRSRWQTVLSSVLVALTWIFGLSLNPAFAVPVTPSMAAENTGVSVSSAAVERDRMSALVTCLPKQLSQPNLKRALDEMGNDQFERVFHLKAEPKFSQAEIDLKNCMSREFTRS